MYKRRQAKNIDSRATGIKINKQSLCIYDKKLIHKISEENADEILP